MLNKKLIIGFIVALIALIVIGFVALNFVPTNDLVNLDVSGNMDNLTENSTVNLSDVSEQLNITEDNGTAVNDTSDDAKDTSDDVNDTNASSDDIDEGDVLHKQTFTITGNETGQNEGMEPGTYVMYYTENDGIIKVDKID